MSLALGILEKVLWIVSSSPELYLLLISLVTRVWRMLSLLMRTGDIHYNREWIVSVG